jgi:hypothetical protein
LSSGLCICSSSMIPPAISFKGIYTVRLVFFCLFIICNGFRSISPHFRLLTSDIHRPV